MQRLFHQDYLSVLHIRFGDLHVRFAVFGDCQAVPDAVDGFGVQFYFFCAPVNLDKLWLKAEFLGDNDRQLCVETGEVTFSSV